MSEQKIEVEERKDLVAEKDEILPAEESEVPEAGGEEPAAAAKAPSIHARLALGVRDQGLAEQHAPELFENTFESEVKVEDSPSFEQDPKLPEELQESVDSVYFPSRPTFHGKERKR